MKIPLKRTPEQIELVKAMASRNRDVAYEAQVALAQFLGPVLAEVINNAPVLSNLFTPLSFNAEDNPSIPLDLYYDITDEDYIQIYSQQVAGGLPTNQVLPSTSEMKITTYTLDSALSFDKRYAAKSRMDVVSKTFTRMAQEILFKQERTSGNLILSALANASTNGKKHVQRANAAGRFLLQDMNELLTLSRRVFTSFTGGTMPTGQSSMGVTDLMISPEIEEELRSMAYNPINTKGSPIGGSTSADAGADTRNTAFITAPDSVRVGLFNGGGVSSFYGVNLMVFNEFGAGKKFNTIFDTVAGDTLYTKADGTSGAKFGRNVADNADTFDELILGLNRNRESLIRAIAVDSETGSEFSLVADDQYSIRQNKIGYFGSLEEGRMVLDHRALFGKIVTRSSNA
jgi:hypothetical protein